MHLNHARLQLLRIFVLLQLLLLHFQLSVHVLISAHVSLKDEKELRLVVDAHSVAHGEQFLLYQHLLHIDASFVRLVRQKDHLVG